MKYCSIVVATTLLCGCAATMGDLKQKASENPALAVAVGAAAAIVIVGTGGVALAVPAAVAGGLYGVNEYEKSSQGDVEKMSCAEAKMLADRNYYGANQRKELLSKACAGGKNNPKK